MRTRRTNRVEEFSAVVVAYLAGGVAAFSPASPTGRPVVDAALLAVSVAAVVYAGASAPWWVTVVVAGAALCVAVDPVLIAVAAVGLAVGLYVGYRRRNLPEWRAVSVGLSLNVMAWGELGGFLGLSAIVAIAAGVVVFVFGIRRRPRAVRRRGWLLAGGVGVLAILAVTGFALSAVGARTDVEAAQRSVQAGISMLDDGDFAAAADEFASAAQSLERADRNIGGPLGWGAAFVPVLAQHRDVAVDLSSSGAELTAQVARALGVVDVDALRVVGGAIDLEALTSLQRPFDDIDSGLSDLAAVVQQADSHWLVPQIRDELTSLDDDITENRPRIENLQSAAQLTPAMLGSQGPRVYLVLFTTPAEARGLGGFPGNYAELTIDGGLVQMTDFGRISDLEARARDAGVTIAGPEGYVSRYARFGFTPQGLAGQAPLRNLTMTPNFPWVGEVAADVYGQVTGQIVDGVIALDPFVIAKMLDYSGPIQLTEVPFALNADNAAEFLLRGQYAAAQDNAERIDALDEAGRLMFQSLLSGALPDPTQLARDLGSLAGERRLLVWTRYGAEQDLLRRVGLLGELPPNGGADGWAFTVNNAGGNKIDSYLEPRATYASRYDPATGETTSTLTVQLTNTAPAEGLPPYVIGNAVGLPPGTNRSLVTFYSSLPLYNSNRDGRQTELSAGRELDWNVYSQYVDIPSGGTVTYELSFAGYLDNPGELVTFTQPLALPLEPL